MKRKLGAAAVAVALGAALPLLLGPGQASVAAPPPASSHCQAGGGVTADVLPESARDHIPADAVAIAGSGFFCGDTPSNQLAATKAARAAGRLGKDNIPAGGKAAPTTTLSSSATTLTASDPNDGTYVCVTAGCWWRKTGWVSAWNGAGYYGVGVTYSDGSIHYLTLGHLTWYFTEAINGRETITSPQSASSNRTVGTWKWADERLYLSSGCPGGCSNPYPYRMVKTQAWQGTRAPGLSMSWYPVYLSSVNNVGSSVAWATTYHLIQFKDWDARYAHILFWAKTKDFKMYRTYDGGSGYHYTYYGVSLPSSPVAVGTSAV